MKFMYPLFLGLLLAAVARRAAPAAEGIPVTPIPAIALHGHTNALVIGNRQLQVTLMPSLGRIAGLRFGGFDNVVRFDAPLAAASLTPPEPGTWRNFGGDWMFPVAQALWPDRFGNRWPPPPFLDGQPWQGHAWISDDGAQHALLTLEVGEPLHIRLHRALRVDPITATVTIRQRMERTAASDIPMTLWNISQVPDAQRVLMPVDDDSAFPDGYAVLDFGPPATQLLARAEGGVLVLDVKNGTEHKLGSDSPRGWIAAQRDHVVIIEHATTTQPGGDFPDGGCRVEVYANRGLGYTEIETLSEERVLQPGEVLENTLTLSFHLVEATLDHTALAQRVRELLGEAPLPGDP
jgi:hypothetical protein